MSWGVLGSFEYGGEATGPLPVPCAMGGEAGMTVSAIVMGVPIAATMGGEFAGTTDIVAFGRGDTGETMYRGKVDRRMYRATHTG